MNQLLMAAARGARIEIRYDGEEEWQATCVVELIAMPNHWVYRIHPDDEHLRFGPISTALWEAAWTSNRFTTVYDVPFGTWGISLHDWEKFRYCLDELHRSLFLLILAEALAEEGL